MTAIIMNLLAPFWPYIAGAGAIIIGFFVARRKGAKAATDKLSAAAAKKTAANTEAGRKAQARAQKALRDGKTPEEITRENDGKWE